MRELLPRLAGWAAAGRPAALATVVAVTGPAPRPVGSALAVGADGEAVGGVSGGCVDADAYERCRAVLGGAAAHTVAYGPDDPYGVGPTCGGTLRVHVARADPDDPALPAVAAAAAAGVPVWLATRLDTGARRALTGDPGDGPGGLGDARLTARVRAALAADPGTAAPGGVAARLLPGPGAPVLLHRFPAPPRLLLYGSGVHAAALAAAAAPLGWRVTACDARPVFTTAARLPGAHEVVVARPVAHLRAHAGTLGPDDAVCVLTHDPGGDAELLAVALRSAAGYVGALGSRTAHAARLARLRAAGLGPAELGRLHAPLGVRLGAATAAEVAVEITAGLLAARRAAAQPATGSAGTAAGTAR